jgi:golgi apparatus protein 1
MTRDIRFDEAAEKQCGADLKILDDCNQHQDNKGSGRLISCLYDQLPNITEASCRYFINQLQAVIFNDWRVTEYFVTACKDDITKFECGRLDVADRRVRRDRASVL